MMTPEATQRVKWVIKWMIEYGGPYGPLDAPRGVACRLDWESVGKDLRDLLAAAEAGAQWKRELAELVGLRRLVAGEPIGVSTGIREQTTYGYGQLDNNGYWEFPVSEVAADFARLIRNDKTELSRLRPLAAQWQQERDEARSDARHLRECLKACKRVAAEQTAAQDQEIARLRPLAEAGERLKEHVLAAIGRLEHELLTPDDIWSDHVQEAVRWLQEGVQAGSTCRVCGRSERQHAKSNPPEVTRDHAFLALLPAEAPAPTKEE